MIRTQIQFTPEQIVALKAKSAESGMAVAELVRDCVRRQLNDDAKERQKRMKRAREAFGVFHDIEGKSDVSVNHDEYLADAYQGR
ncbi:MAG: hypothetical protein SFV18_22185 [Bryobacteraceae bacterium]|nr:hypothetical protein [Bryobacteraceae bacterium]